MNRTELDLLIEVYPSNFDDLQKKQDTEKFLETKGKDKKIFIIKKLIFNPLL